MGCGTWCVPPSSVQVYARVSNRYPLSASALKILLFVVALWLNWEVLSPYVAKDIDNPFRPLLFISHRVPDSAESDPRYQKGWLDLAFLAR